MGMTFTILNEQPHNKRNYVKMVHTGILWTGEGIKECFEFLEITDHKLNLFYWLSFSATIIKRLRYSTKSLTRMYLSKSVFQYWKMNCNRSCRIQELPKSRKRTRMVNSSSFLMCWCHFKDTADEILKELIEMHLNFYRSDHGLLKVAKKFLFLKVSSWLKILHC